MPDIAGVVSALRATEPTKIRDLPSEKLIEYEQFLAEQSPQFGHDAKQERLRQECQHRIFELRSERQHREVRGTGKKTLFWAAVGGVTGILILVADYVPLVRDTFFSKAQPASVQQATLETPPQSLSTTSGSPEPEASSNSSTPSPKQAATAQPSVSPPESSNNTEEN